jgi:hypothetical protein
MIKTCAACDYLATTMALPVAIAMFDRDGLTQSGSACRSLPRVALVRPIGSRIASRAVHDCFILAGSLVCIRDATEAIERVRPMNKPKVRNLFGNRKVRRSPKPPARSSPTSTTDIFAGADAAFRAQRAVSPLSYGIVASHRALCPPEEAREILRRAQANYLMTCGSRVPKAQTESERQHSLWARLAAGNVPDWLEPIPNTGLFNVYRFKH